MICEEAYLLMRVEFAVVFREWDFKRKIFRCAIVWTDVGRRVNAEILCLGTRIFVKIVHDEVIEFIRCRDILFMVILYLYIGI